MFPELNWLKSIKGHSSKKLSIKRPNAIKVSFVGIFDIHFNEKIEFLFFISASSHLSVV